MSLFSELKRRKVIRVVVAYVLVGWALIQIADATLEPLHLPEWAGTMVVWLVALGFPIAVVLAWVVDITPEGVKATAALTRRQKASTLPAAAQPPEASIAVLPFVNLSDDPDNEYFGNGIAEELLNLMARLQSIRVCSRTSSFALKGKNLDMPAVGARLGVRHVLEGSVRRAGNRVRITTQLIDAAEDKHLWSETYDRDLEDIFAVQAEIAGHIFGAMKVNLSAADRQAIRSTTDNVDALDLYLRGREYYHRSESGHLEKSRECFEEAIRIDPDYALAHAGLTYAAVDIYWYSRKESKWLDLAEKASRKAVDLAPQLAESHAARGLALRAAERFEEAELEFEKAIAINPRLFEPWHFYAQMVRTMGETERSIELFQRAAEVRPEDYQALAVASGLARGLGDSETQRILELEGIERVQRAIEVNPNDGRAWILGAGMYGHLGEREQAREWMAKALSVDSQTSGMLYNAACIHASLGEIERAIDFLEQAVVAGSRNKRYFENDADLDHLREHPRFKALLKRV